MTNSVNLGRRLALKFLGMAPAAMGPAVAAGTALAGQAAAAAGLDMAAKGLLGSRPGSIGYGAASNASVGGPPVPGPADLLSSMSYARRILNNLEHGNNSPPKRDEIRPGIDCFRSASPVIKSLMEMDARETEMQRRWHAEMANSMMNKLGG